MIHTLEFSDISFRLKCELTMVKLEMPNLPSRISPLSLWLYSGQNPECLLCPKFINSLWTIMHITDRINKGQQGQCLESLFSTEVTKFMNEYFILRENTFI